MSRTTDRFLQKWGDPSQFVEVPDERFSAFAGTVPDLLLDFWRNCGYSGFHNGLLWICDPIQWQPAVDAWTAGLDLEMGQDQWIAVRRTAFGTMELWGRRTGLSLVVVPHRGWIFPTDNSDEMATAQDRDAQIYALFLGSSPESLDISDENEQDMFDRALELNGPVGPDTMYGFVPAVALGGPMRVANIEAFDAAVHMQLLSDMTPRQILVEG